MVLIKIFNYLNLREYNPRFSRTHSNELNDLLRTGELKQSKFES